jgi:hypothetical protein
MHSPAGQYMKNSRSPRFWISLRKNTVADLCFCLYSVKPRKILLKFSRRPALPWLIKSLPIRSALGRETISGFRKHGKSERCVAASTTSISYWAMGWDTYSVKSVYAKNDSFNALAYSSSKREKVLIRSLTLRYFSQSQAWKTKVERHEFSDATVCHHEFICFLFDRKCFCAG